MTRRLLFVCNNLNIGGPQKGLIGVLDRLDTSQFTCTIVSLTPGGALRPYLEERFRVLDVPPVVRAVQVNKRSIARDVTTLFRHRAATSLLMYLAALVAAALRRPVNPWRQRTWYAARHRLPMMTETFDAAFAVSSGLSTYYVTDCVDATHRYHWVVGDYSRTPIARRVDRHYFGQLTGGLAVSDECSEIFTRLFPESDIPRPIPFRFPVPWRFYDRNEGIGTPEYDDRAGARVLTVSRLEHGKGIGLALDAARVLLDRGVQFTWLILGDGELRSSLEARADVLALGPAVQFSGFRQNVSEYLRSCDVFVLPSSSEGRSTAVDEAMALGVVPVLTDYRTARSQVTDGETGLISAFDAHELARCIERALDPSTREVIRHNLRDHQDEDPVPLFLALSS